MGLDSYLFEVRSDMACGDFHFEEDKFVKPYELQYWRRNWSVQRLMERLYRLKRGTNPHFNGQPVRIDSKDLDFIRSEIKHEHETDPYWWGSDQTLEAKLQIVDKIEKALKEGNSVYYNSSW
jgi:hypothetical protein